MTTKSTSLNHSLWSIADNFSQQVLAFIIFAILARWLSPQEFGLLAIAHLLVQFVRLAVLDALALPILRMPVIDRMHFHWLFTQCTLVSIIAAIFIAASAPLLTNYFHAPALLSVVLGMSAVTILYGLNRAHDAMLLRQADFRLLALRSLISVAGGGIVAIACARAGYGALALVAQQLTTTCLTFLISLCAEWQRWRPRWYFSMPLLREHGRESLKAAMSSMLLYANSNGDAALVSIVLGPHAAGLYNLGKRVTSAVSLMIAAALSRVASALFFRSVSDHRVLAEHYCRMSTLTLSGLLLIYGLIANFAAAIVRIVFGSQWQAAAPLLVILSIAGVFQALFNIGQNLSMATGYTARALRIGAIQLTLAIIFSLTLSLALPLVSSVALEREQLIGMAIGFCIATVLSAAVMHRFITAQLQLPVTKALLPLLSPLIALLCLTVTSQWLLAHYAPITGWLQLCTVNIIATIAYVACIGFLHRFLNRNRFVKNNSSA